MRMFWQQGRGHASVVGSHVARQKCLPAALCMPAVPTRRAVCLQTIQETTTPRNYEAPSPLKYL